MYTRIVEYAILKNKIKCYWLVDAPPSNAISILLLCQQKYVLNVL